MTSNHGANKFEADSRKISPFTARVHKFSKHVIARRQKGDMMQVPY